MVRTPGVAASGQRRRETLSGKAPRSREGSSARSAPARSGQFGGALLGFLVGLIVGLGIAVVVALFVTRAPVPFVNKGNRSAERLVVPPEGAALPDPNAPLHSSPRESMPATPPPTAGASSGPAASGAVLPPGPSASLPGSSAPSSAMPPDARRTEGGFLLQAGAFRASADAEGMKARLALLGLEARVIPAEVNGQPMYRVRIGPFAQQDEANRARERLADGGIEASVIRQR
jgi:cell division protein FtsN